MSRHRLLPVVVSLLTTIVVAALLGCGGGGGSDSTEKASPAVLAHANANCRQLRRDLVKLGRSASLGGGINIAEVATEDVIKPSIPLLEEFAGRQQRLAKGSSDPQLELYARLFEPIIVLAHERLRSGEESDSPLNTAARGFEILTVTVAEEQRQVAREAGLPACAIDFQRVLTSALRS